MTHIAPSIYTYANLVGFIRSAIKDNPSVKEDLVDILQMCREDLEEMSEGDAVRLAVTVLRDTYGDAFVTQNTQPAKS